MRTITIARTVAITMITLLTVFVPASAQATTASCNPRLDLRHQLTIHRGHYVARSDYSMQYTVSCLRVRTDNGTRMNLQLAVKRDPVKAGVGTTRRTYQYTGVRSFARVFDTDNAFVTVSIYAGPAGSSVVRYVGTITLRRS